MYPFSLLNNHIKRMVTKAWRIYLLGICDSVNLGFLNAWQLDIYDSQIFFDFFNVWWHNTFSISDLKQYIVHVYLYLEIVLEVKSNYKRKSYQYPTDFTERGSWNIDHKKCQSKNVKSSETCLVIYEYKIFRDMFSYIRIQNCPRHV